MSYDQLKGGGETDFQNISGRGSTRNSRADCEIP